MKRFKNILVLVEEGTSVAPSAMERAVALAEAHQADLAVLSVVQRPRLGPFAAVVTREEYEARVRQQESARLEAMLDPYRGRVAATVEVRFGTAFIEAIQDVLGNRRDLVLKSAGYGGAHDFLFGGTDQHLLRKCPCPVWIMQPSERPQYQRIMAAVDFDPWDDDDREEGLNRSILELAGALALADFAELHVVHAWVPVTENIIRVFGSDLSDGDATANLEREQHDHMHHLEHLDGCLQRWVGKEAYNYLTPRLHLRKGNARDIIPALAAELKVDLVVMGTVSRTGVPGLLIGNTAEVILNNIACAVLAVKPAGFVSPVEARP